MPDTASEARFECLQCGKSSHVETVQAIQPRCARCGSGTGIVGNAGQASLTVRLRRNLRLGGDYGADTEFECLGCGEVTRLERVYLLRPKCHHCGALSGVLVEIPRSGQISVVLAGAMGGLLDTSPG